jgi:hypothetical protein
MMRSSPNASEAAQPAVAPKIAIPVPGKGADPQIPAGAPKPAFDNLDKAQIGLDVVGLVPVAGNVTSAANLGISTGRFIHAAATQTGEERKDNLKKHGINAVLSGIGIIPVVGNAAKGAQLAATGVKVAKAGKCVARGAKVVKLSQQGRSVVTATKAAKYAMAAKTLKEGVQMGRYAVVGAKVGQVAADTAKVERAATAGSRVRQIGKGAEQAAARLEAAKVHYGNGPRDLAEVTGPGAGAPAPGGAKVAGVKAVFSSIGKRSVDPAATPGAEKG